MVARGQQNNLRCVVFFRLTFVVALWLMNNEKKNRKILHVYFVNCDLFYY